MPAGHTAGGVAVESHRSDLTHDSTSGMSEPAADCDALVADARAIFDAGVRNVQADRLLPDADALAPALAPPASDGRLVVLGLGKAAMAMAGVLESRLRDGARERLGESVAVVPEGYPSTLPDRLPAPEQIEVQTAGHPVPTAASQRAGQRLLQVAGQAGAGDRVLVLISGGGTALTTCPAEGLALEDVQDTFRRLLRSGTDVEAANVVRKHLTQVGGGQLARAAAPAAGTAWVVSDVIGDPLSAIASGPTVPDPSTYADAMRVLYRQGLWHDVAESIRAHLAAGAEGKRPETPGARTPCFKRVTTTLVGTNRTALEAARAAAERRGYDVQVVTHAADGEAREVGRAHGRKLRASKTDAPTCWLWGGETTVTVTGDGTGGRNQEVALGAAQTLAEDGTSAVLLSGGTDGIDGPTDAAGAWATPQTLERAQNQGLDADDHLARNDSYAFFDAVNQLLRTGPTHTNVMDLHVGLRRP